MRRSMRVRNRALIVLLLPVALVLWMVGWVLYWNWSRGNRQVMTGPTVRDNSVEVGVALLEEDVMSSS